MSKQLGVFGWPVTYSLSPVFQGYSLKAKGLDAQYQLFPCETPEAFRARFKALSQDPDFVGGNVTNPYKLEAAAIADRRSPAVEALGAANTLVRRDFGFEAFNTDASGFLGFLEDQAIQVRDRKVVVLGSGGVTRAIVWALGQFKPAETVILSIEPDQAEACAKLAHLPRTAFLDEANTSRETADALLVINALPKGEVSAKFGRAMAPASPGAVAIDANYLPFPVTDFIVEASKQGWSGHDGLALLINQGRVSFKLWFDQDPPEYSVLRNILLEHLKKAPPA